MKKSYAHGVMNLLIDMKISTVYIMDVSNVSTIEAKSRINRYTRIQTWDNYI